MTDVPIYVNKKIVYMPTYGEMAPGFFREIEPVTIAPLENLDELGEAIKRAIEQGNPIVPRLSTADWPRPLMLKYIKARSWTALARASTLWAIREMDGIFTIIRKRPIENGAWNDDPDQKMQFPPDLALEEVYQQMAAILQAGEIPR